MKHRTLVPFVLALLAVPPGAPPARAEPPAGPATGSAPWPVAVVLSQPIERSEIEPPPDPARQSGDGQEAEAFAQRQLQARAKWLARRVQVRLLDAYAKRLRLEPTEAELRPLLSSDLPGQVYESVRQVRHAEIRQKLATPGLDPAERERLAAELAEWERIPVSREAEILAENRRMASVLVQNWKVQRSLYRRYGGRVLVSGFGYDVAVDATRRFLQEEEKRGSFEIYDPELRVAFWAEMADETWADCATAGRGADEVFATPPWQRADRRPGR